MFCPICGWQFFNDRCVRCRRTRQWPRPRPWYPNSTAAAFVRALLNAHFDEDGAAPIHNRDRGEFTIPERLVFDALRRARLDGG